MGIFLHELIYQHQRQLNSENVQCCKNVIGALELCGVDVIPPPEGVFREWSVVVEERRQWQDEAAKIAASVVLRYSQQDKKLLEKNSNMFDEVISEACRVSSTVVDRQNRERKKLLNNLKVRIKFP